MRNTWLLTMLREEEVAVTLRCSRSYLPTVDKIDSRLPFLPLQLHVLPSSLNIAIILRPSLLFGFLLVAAVIVRLHLHSQYCIHFRSALLAFSSPRSLLSSTSQRYIPCLATMKTRIHPTMAHILWTRLCRILTIQMVQSRSVGNRCRTLLMALHREAQQVRVIHNTPRHKAPHLRVIPSSIHRKETTLDMVPWPCHH